MLPVSAYSRPRTANGSSAPGLQLIRGRSIDFGPSGGTRDDVQRPVSFLTELPRVTRRGWGSVLKSARYRRGDGQYALARPKILAPYGRMVRFTLAPIRPGTRPDLRV